MHKHVRFTTAMLLGGTALSFGLAPPAAAGTISVQVYSAFAPNHHGSPSYLQWAENAVSALETSSTSAGTVGQPTYFQETVPGTHYNPVDNIPTSFKSWDGLINPSGAYAAEEGNRITFVALVKDNNGLNDISLSQLSETLTGSGNSNAFDLNYGWSNDTLNYGGPSYPDTYIASPDGSPLDTYSSTQVGVMADGSQVTSGANTQLVNELVVVGWGNALANSDVSSCNALGATQAAIQCIQGAYKQWQGFNMTASFGLGGALGSGTVEFAPEPASLALFGSAIAGLGLLGRRRKKA